MAEHHVLHVINSLGFSGGAEQQLLANLASFRDHSLRHSVCRLYEYEATDRTEQLPGGMHLHTLFGVGEVRSRPAAVRRLDLLVRQLRPNLIHATLQDASLAARLVTARRRIPLLESFVNISHDLVRTIDNPAVTPTKLRFHRLVDRGTIRRRQHFHALSQVVADSWVDAVGLDAARIRIIPRGIDTTHYRPAATISERTWLHENLGLPEEARILLNVGRHEPQKGQRYLLQAFEIIASECEDVALVLIGRRGNVSDDLQQLARSSRHSARIHFFPEQADVAPFMRSAEIFVFSSLFEGLGVSLLESLASAVPAVVFDRPPMSELVLSSGGGVVAAPRDPAALAREAIRLLGEPERLRDMGSAARSYVAREHSVAATAAATEEYYREILVRFARTGDSL
jgi:glycosyltransferase involved in cell wall biosynthesis